MASRHMVRWAKGPPPDQTVQHRRFAFRVRVCMAYLMLASVMSGLFNYLGILNFNEAVGDLGFVSHGMAGLLAVTVGLALHIAWFLAFSIHPESGSLGLRRQGHGLIALTALFALAVSSSLNLMGLAGGASTVMTLAEHVQTITRQTDAAFEAGASSDDYLTALRGQQIDLCDAALREETIGGASGGAGPGVVSASYRSACQQTTAAVAALETAGTEQTVRIAAMRDALDVLAAAIDDPSLSARERVKAYRRRAGHLRDLIRAGRASGVARSVALSVRSLNSLVPPAEAMGGYSQGQRAALEGLRHRLEGFVALMRDAAVQDTGADLQALSIPEPPTPLEAVFAQFAQTFPFICVAVGVDLASLWFAAWLGLNRAQLRERASPHLGGSHV